MVHQGDSCSEFVKQSIIEHGLFRSITLIKLRFAECKEAALLYNQASKNKKAEDESNQDNSSHPLEFLNCVPLPCDLGIEACACSIF